MRYHKSRWPLLAALLVLCLGWEVRAETILLNYTTFDKDPITGTWPNSAEPITDGGGDGFNDVQSGDVNFSPKSDTINGWTLYQEQSTANQMTFVPGSPLALAAPSGVGEARLGSKFVMTMDHGAGGILADVLNMDFGGSGTICGIAQTFNSQDFRAGLYGEVTIEVTWGRHERVGNGLDIVDGLGDFGTYDYTYQSGTYGTTYTHTFTPTEPQFRLFFASNLGADTNGSIDSIRVSSLSAIPEPGTLALLGIALLGLAWYAWRKRR